MKSYVWLMVWLLVACSPKIDTSGMKVLFLEKDQNWQADRPRKVTTELDVLKTKQRIQEARASTRWRVMSNQENYAWYGEEVFKILAKDQLVVAVDATSFLVADLTKHRLSLYKTVNKPDKSSTYQASELKLPAGELTEFSVFSYADGYLLMGNRDDNELFMYQLVQSATTAKVELQLLWRSSLYDLIASAPAISTTAVFCQTSSNKLYKLDRETGKVLWIKFAEDYEVKDNSSISPLLIKDQVIVFFTSGNVVAFNQADGKIVWQNYVGNDFGISSPLQILHTTAYAVVEDNILYLAGAYKGIHAIDLNSGKILWQTRLLATSPLLIQGSELCFLTSGELLNCVQKHNGLLDYHESPAKRLYNK